MPKFNPWKVGDKVKFAHQRHTRIDEGGKVYTVFWASRCERLEDPDAVIELKELPGIFSARLFVAADYPTDSIVPRPERS